jgi:hypothetical protein
LTERQDIGFAFYLTVCALVALFRALGAEEDKDKEEEEEEEEEEEAKLQ